MRFGARETLFNQFNAVRTQTVTTHVNIYGEIEMGQSRLQDFLHYKLEKELPNIENHTSPLIGSLLRLNSGGEENVDDKDEEADDESYMTLREYFDEEDLDQIDEGERNESLNFMNEVEILPAFMGEEEKANDGANITAVSGTHLMEMKLAGKV